MWNFLGFLRKPDSNSEAVSAEINADPRSFFVHSGFAAGPQSSFANSGFAASSFAPRNNDSNNVDPAATYRELVKTMYRDTIRMAGIPKNWLTCEVLTMTEAGKARFHIQFVVRQWDQEFLDYLPAFQKTFLDRVQRFSPALTERICAVAWRFSSNCGCSLLTLPPAGYWSDSARQARALAREQREVEALLSQRTQAHKSDAHFGFQDTRPMMLPLHANDRR
ncbi:MAG: hypothetical protein RLZZ612_2315 [Pseudomonadota bacterium]|jgi:hypothetical protein